MFKSVSADRLNTGSNLLRTPSLTSLTKTRTSSLEEQRFHSISRVATCCCDITRKESRLRDYSDQLAHALYRIGGDLADEEFVLTANLLSRLQDYRHTKVQRLDHHVVKPLTQMCKQAKNELKSLEEAQKKQRNLQTQLDKLRQEDPPNPAKLARLEAELQRTRTHTSSSSEQTAHRMKEILQNFVATEMAFHAKALELTSSMASYFDEDASVDSAAS